METIYNIVEVHPINDSISFVYDTFCLTEESRDAAIKEVVNKYERRGYEIKNYDRHPWISAVGKDKRWHTVTVVKLCEHDYEGNTHAMRLGYIAHKAQ